MKNFLASGRVHYGWIIVVVTFITMLGAAGIRATPTVLILPLEQEFGWDRATISLAISINLILFGLCGPFAAALMERVGMRATMAGALLLLASAVGLTTQLSAAWQLVLLWGVLVGLGTGAMSGWIAATVSNRWFVARRGLVVGILTVANATGQLIFLPVLASLATSAGWRTAVFLVAGCALLVIPLVVLFVRNYPEDVGLRAYGAEPVADLGDQPAGAGVGVGPAGAGRLSGAVPGQGRAVHAQGPVAAALTTLRRGLGNRDFLLLAGTFFICGASTNGLIGTHLIPASHDHGIPEVTAASLLALIGVFDVAGTLVSGWLSDRFDSRKLLAWYYSLRGLSLLFLPYAFEAGISPLAIFMVFYGLDWVATVPPTVRLASDLFGKQHAGRVYAWVLAAHQLGAAAIAYGAGSLRQWLGTYTASFVLSGLLCLLAGAMAMRIARPAAASGGLAASGQ